MERQSCLNDPSLPVVADTSVVINLNASRCAEAILDALPNRFLVVPEVRLELEEDRHTGRNDTAASTIDLLAQDDVQTVLGRDRLANAVFDALYYGRMRVLPHHLRWPHTL